MRTLRTVNCVEIITGTIDNVIAFRDTPAGNKKAEKLFSEMAAENGARQEDLESYLDDGRYQDGGYEVCLVHSN
jgi:hypothetical protein